MEFRKRNGECLSVCVCVCVNACCFVVVYLLRWMSTPAAELAISQFNLKLLSYGYFLASFYLPFAYLVIIIKISLTLDIGTYMCFFFVPFALQRCNQLEFFMSQNSMLRTSVTSLPKRPNRTRLRVYIYTRTHTAYVSSWAVNAVLPYICCYRRRACLFGRLGLFKFQAVVSPSVVHVARHMVLALHYHGNKKSERWGVVAGAAKLI